jgi:hypothetical protein
MVIVIVANDETLNIVGVVENLSSFHLSFSNKLF